MSDCYKFKKEDNEEIKSIANVIREKKILDNKIIMDSFESFNFKDNDEKKEFMMTTTKLFLNDRKIEENEEGNQVKYFQVLYSWAGCKRRIESA